MSEVTLDDVFRELADEEEAKLDYDGSMGEESIPIPVTKLHEEAIDRKSVFTDCVKYLNRLSHEIEDIAGVATRMIAQRRNHYNYVFMANKPLLQEYAIEHLKRDKDGQITGKSYKTLEAGGGVFFRAKPQTIRTDDTKLADIRAFIERYLPDKVEVVAEKTVYSVPDKQAFIDVLTNIAEAKATELVTSHATAEGLTDTEQIEFEIKEATKKGLEEICNEFRIEIEPSDAFAFMHIGVTKGNTFRHLKSNLVQALDGSFRPNEEEEFDLIIEELS